MINKVVIYNLLSALAEKFSLGNVDFLLINLIFAVLLILLGIFLGKLAKYLVKRGIERSGIERTKQKSFVELLLSVIKWSIYILFFIIALDQMRIPQLTNWLTSILVVVPALVGALILVGTGFALATYLKDLIEDSKIEGWEIFSKLIFYFLLYIFMVFAFKTALIGQDEQVVNVLVVIITTILGIGIAYREFRR